MRLRPGDNGSPAVADAELQADVMRFVAILALCLVAISTLVEGYRSAPAPDEPRKPVSSTIHDLRESAPTATAPNDPSVARGADLPPVPDRPAPTQPAVAAVTAPDPDPSADATPEAPAPAAATTEMRHSPEPPAPAAAVTETRQPIEPPVLTLRFVTDAALLRLVARGDAGVFVLSGAESLALDLGSGVAFKPAPMPRRYHSMTPDTVPAVLKAAYEGPGDAAWAVTLPGHTLAAIDDYMARSKSGVLVIDAQGRVGLERTDE